VTPQPASHTLRETIRDLAPIGTALINAAAHLAEMRDQLPPRGPLTEEFRELVACLAYIERTYRNADEALLVAYTQLEHQERVPRPLALARQLNGHT
jgi:hypothetical protein